MGAVISKVNGLGPVEKEHLAAKLYDFTLAETLGVTDPAQGPSPRAEGPCLSTLCAETRRSQDHPVSTKEVSKTATPHWDNPNGLCIKDHRI